MIALLSTLPALLKINKLKLEYIAINIIFIFAFAIIYWIWGTPEHFKVTISPEPKYLTFLDAIYLSFVTHCTIGYGDIVPISPWMKIVTILHTLIIIAYLVLIIA